MDNLLIFVECLLNDICISYILLSNNLLVFACLINSSINSNIVSRNKCENFSLNKSTMVNAIC